MLKLAYASPLPFKNYIITNTALVKWRKDGSGKLPYNGGQGWKTHDKTPSIISGENKANISLTKFKVISWLFNEKLIYILYIKCLYYA